ncbi:5-formyltetrahydrofolate cyclo-ligase [Tropicimonas sp. TH_r6]|uniref:5-formyltetrahydrofolate cyclo-ligase n=1 Tax=Tropicimonas sp. TH_r6 TaxID=3082085 RepID=UPI002952EDE0|nr:5-formyltetrahydrofolate cyclo-ligase [Tropicimonas sp. TH_r6]MDV7143322.1 5-formyltetrahydrofolate cyclo-ligase [Tropicimonas sp. TH_r6]
MTLAKAKKAARSAAFARRKAAHSAHAAAASEALNAHLSETRGRIVGGYLPIRTEANPLPALEMLARHNRIAMPIVSGAGLPLLFREWWPGCRLEAGTFDVMVPVEGADLVPDLIIAPLVAFDRKLYRLGYGGGFYDRTLERLRACGQVEALGFAYEAQGTDALPLEPTDQPLDGLVTELGMRLCED